MLGAANKVEKFTYIGSSSSIVSTLTIPATAREGDVAILFDKAVNINSPIPTAVNPSGWTQLATTSAGSFSLNYVRVILSVKILAAADIGTTLTLMTNITGSLDKAIYIFRPNFPIKTLSSSTITVGAYNSSVNNQTVTVTTAAGLGRKKPYLMFFMMISNSSSITTKTTTGFSPINEVANRTNYFRYGLINDGTTAVDTVGSFAGSGNEAMFSGYLYTS